MEHEYYMQRAIELAQAGLGKAAPNPMVGCVIISGNKIISEGYHHQFGGPHAEVNAIKQVTNKEILKDSTLYVTLEPCSHFGKTPPCADLIISRGIPKVVIGTLDSNPLVKGQGVAKLKSAGIEVVTGILENECRFLNRRFFTFYEKHRPYYILKWAQSKDGFIDPERMNNEQGSIQISSHDSLRLSHKWRTEEQAILVGKNTVMTDDPELTPRLVNGKAPLRIVIDRNCEIPSEKKIMSGVETLILNEQLNSVHANVTYHKINFNDFFNELNRTCFELKIQSVIVEGGKITLEHFIKNSVWDEARIFISQEFISRGLTAPEFKQKAKKEISVGTDKLQYYYREG